MKRDGKRWKMRGLGVQKVEMLNRKRTLAWRSRDVKCMKSDFKYLKGIMRKEIYPFFL